MHCHEHIKLHIVGCCQVKNETLLVNPEKRTIPESLTPMPKVLTLLLDDLLYSLRLSKPFLADWT